MCDTYEEWGMFFFILCDWQGTTYLKAPGEPDILNFQSFSGPPVITSQNSTKLLKWIFFLKATFKHYYFNCTKHRSMFIFTLSSLSLGNIVKRDYTCPKNIVNI